MQSEQQLNSQSIKDFSIKPYFSLQENHFQLINSINIPDLQRSQPQNNQFQMISFSDLKNAFQKQSSDIDMFLELSRQQHQDDDQDIMPLIKTVESAFMDENQKKNMELARLNQNIQIQNILVENNDVMMDKMSENNDEIVESLGELFKGRFKLCKNAPKIYANAFKSYLNYAKQKSLNLICKQFNIQVNQFFEYINNVSCLSLKNLREMFDPEIIPQCKSSKAKNYSTEKILIFKKIYRIFVYKFLREEILEYFLNNKRVKTDKMKFYSFKQIIMQGLKNPKHLISWKLE